MSSNNKLHDSYRAYVKRSTTPELVPFIKMVHGRIENRRAKEQSPIAADKEFYRSVESMINDELAAALGIGRDDVEPFIEQRTGLTLCDV